MTEEQIWGHFRMSITALMNPYTKYGMGVHISETTKGIEAQAKLAVKQLMEMTDGTNKAT